MKKCSLLAFFCILLSSTLLAQNSPFSSVGLGNILDDAYVPQQGMAGAGAALSNPLYANNVNPALLTANKQFIFEIGTVGKMQTLSDDTQSQQDFSGNLGYFGLVMPFTKKWTGQVGLKPYSRIEYEFRTSSPIENSDFVANYRYKGSGGLNSFFFSNGVTVWKDLHLGLKVNYIFGGLKTENISELLLGGNNTNIASFDRLNVGDLIFTPAIAYKYMFKNKTKLNVGLVYDMGVDARTRQFRSVERRNINDAPLSIDTTTIDRSGSIFIPQRFRAGIAYEKPFEWAIAADIIWQPWEEYRELGNSFGLQNTMGFAIGGEYTPDYRAVKGLFKRMTYRAGVRYQQLPLEINGSQVSDFGINFGTSLPIGVNQLATTYLHLGVAFGQRGSISENNIQERYTQFSLGVSLSDFLWFRKSKID